MLQFIYGKPSSGKTTYIIEKIKELSQANKKSVLIVPEQFTFENEKNILKSIGDNAFLNTTVLSFTRLCDEVYRNIGGFAGKMLGEADKVIILSRALGNVKNDLKLWGKFTGNINFSKTVLDTIGEFKINSYSPEDIFKFSQECDNAPLAVKLFDLATIYREYDLLLGERFIDPADNLTKLYFSLKNYEYFKGKTVFIDSFKGFTGQQFKIIDRILSQAEDVYLSATYNPENNKEYGIFSNIRKSCKDIEKIALKNSVFVNEPIFLNKSYYNEDFDLLEKLMAGEDVSVNENIQNINIIEASNSFAEAQFAARIIRNLVRTKGYRYRDFVIISRDAGAYKQAVLSSCKENGVSLFYDEKIPLSAFPFSVAVEKIISALNMSTENILQFHKTGLGTLSFEEISTLENYTYLWNVTGDLWLKDWDMDPRGFTNEPDTAEMLKDLEYINALRKRAVEPIVNFKNSLTDYADGIVTAIMKLFDECDVSSKLFDISNKLSADNDGYEFDLLSSAYEEFIKILDSIIICFENKRISISQFEEIFALSVSLCEIGVIPQLLDQVTFGSADRIRTSRPKVAIILGANQGVFPKTINNSGIFNVGERKKLIDNGLIISDNSLFSSIDEEYLVYSNLCCASDMLFVCYSNQTFTGELTEPSYFVKKIKDKLCVETQRFNGCGILPETEQSAFSEYCRNRFNDKDYSASLELALKDTAYKSNIDFIKNISSNSPKSLTSDTAKKLFGKNISFSPSKLDVFSRCKFSYFCKFGLKVKDLEPVEFSVLQRGTIVHYVLEKIIGNHYEEILNAEEPFLGSLTDKYINEYLESVTGYKANEDKRSLFLVSRLSRSLKEVVFHISKELSISKFKPIACELSIGYKDSDIKVEFPFDEGTIYLNGSVDRVDEYNGYIRIIDYKTGTKAFKLPDILFGLNMQMLIYLYSVIRGRNLEDTKAAGILYQPSKRDISDNGLAMNGLLQKDLNLVLLMDENNSGEFVPKLKINKDGSFAKSNPSFIDKENFSDIFDYIELLMKKTGKSLLSGDIAVSPTDGRESESCKYCSFSTVCNIENKPHEKVPNLGTEDLFELMKEEISDGV